jgi:hypothetical protein
MGREAKCQCKWGAEQAESKVLLEGSELILRLGIRRRVPVSAMAGVAVRGDNLIFSVGQDQVELSLGTEIAQRWAKAITSPLPSLARKLGISPATKLAIVGDMQSEALKEAVAEASPGKGKEVDLTLICINSPSEINPLLQQHLTRKTGTGPVWIVYPKGAGSGVKESVLRELLRGHGFIDTKVASVSPKLTAIRFIKRKSDG